MLKLSDQIMVLYKKLRITEIETRLRFFMCSLLEESLKGILHQTTITPFGSSVNSFGRFDCDLDMVLELENEECKVTHVMLTLSIVLLRSFSLFGIGASSHQSPRSPVLCFYLYSFLLHVFSYIITPPQFQFS